MAYCEVNAHSERMFHSQSVLVWKVLRKPLQTSILAQPADAQLQQFLLLADLQ